jgi:hypothetical protein
VTAVQADERSLDHIAAQQGDPKNGERVVVTLRDNLRLSAKSELRIEVIG